MDFELPIGVKGLQEIVVTSELTASAFNSGLVEVFATPAMVALMEKTCQLSIQPLLPDGFITVGTLVNIRHLKATPVGMMVHCESELAEQDRKKLTFKVKVWDETGIIGDGLHERFIVNADDFMNKLTKTK